MQTGSLNPSYDASATSGSGLVKRRGAEWTCAHFGHATLVHECHAAAWVACYDLRLSGAVVVESHRKGGRVGMVVRSNLNKVRVLLLPFICFNLLGFWLQLFPNPDLSSGFYELISLVNHATFSVFSAPSSGQFSFSSA
ncbi:MAG: hypothetical protein F6J87_17320 [Spirulina sp. SIO3F2]|nr:hypothetical protein [Spirulina sp. SIO3F2]